MSDSNPPTASSLRSAENADEVVQAFLDRQTQLKPLVEDELDSLSQFDELCPEELKSAIRHSLLAPAKRLRPLLVLMATEACGGSISAAMPAACAVEMIHTYSLIHDDLPAMDDDDLRRGLPSCHAKFGEATAILAGDALLAQAFEVISQVDPPEVALACCQELSHTAGATQLVGGQIDDLAAENRTDLTQADLVRIHSRKTGAMIRISVRLGGLIAQIDAEQLTNLSDFGSKIGLAFQIVDDLLDYSGDQVKIGKSLGKDSKSQKLTYVKLFGEEKSRQMANDLIHQAQASVKDLGPAAAPLLGLAQFILSRTY